MRIKTTPRFNVLLTNVARIKIIDNTLPGENAGEEKFSCIAAVSINSYRQSFGGGGHLDISGKVKNA